MKNNGTEAVVHSGAAEAENGGTVGQSTKPRPLTAEELLQGDLGNEVKIRRAKKCKNVSAGVCHVLATFNNTKISISDANGAVLSWSSAGKNNFRGSRKSTAYAAQVAAQDAARAAMAHGLKELDVRLKGPGPGRDAAVRALQTLDLQISSICDVTPLPHNGCRPRRPRRP
jgi:small subunit ribosomal protein S11